MQVGVGVVQMEYATTTDQWRRCALDETGDAVPLTIVPTFAAVKPMEREGGGPRSRSGLLAGEARNCRQRLDVWTDGWADGAATMPHGPYDAARVRWHGFHSPSVLHARLRLAEVKAKR